MAGITTYSDCDAARSQVAPSALMYNQPSNSNVWPTGCFEWDNGYFYFNIYPGGHRHRRATLVCTGCIPDSRRSLREEPEQPERH